MADVFSKDKRSDVMSRIRGRDTRPERAVRSILHKLGFRFRLQARHLPGKPDIVLPKYRTVIMVHGCFWHRHSHCKYAYTPKTRTEFWNTKLSANVARDRKTGKALRALGWRIITVWECELKHGDHVPIRLMRALRETSKLRRDNSAERSRTVPGSFLQPQ
jgi:DNA mismatch endonuclease (patch repair protein)